MTRVLKVGVAVGIFFVAFAITWFVYFPDSPLAKQEANLKLAENHRPIVRERLRRMNGVENAEVEVHTGLDGSLAVNCNVADERMAEAVMREVLTTEPPVSVQFLFSIGETNIIQKVQHKDRPKLPR